MQTQDANRLEHAVGEAGEALRHAVDDVAISSRARAREFFEGSRKSLNKGLDLTHDRADQVQSYLLHRIKDRPIAATAAALGLGLLIGLVMRPRQ